MIQRIQSVYLLLASLCGMTLFFVEFANFTADSNTFVLDFLGISITSEGTNFSPVSSMVITSFSVMSFLLPFVAIFLFKNRQNQLKLTYVSLALSGGVFATALFYILGISNFIPPAEDLSTSYGIGLIIPLVEMVFLFLASLGINKDENLIKSLDRLR